MDITQRLDSSVGTTVEDLPHATISAWFAEASTTIKALRAEKRQHDMMLRAIRALALVSEATAGAAATIGGSITDEARIELAMIARHASDRVEHIVQYATEQNPTLRPSDADRKTFLVNDLEWLRRQLRRIDQHSQHVISHLPTDDDVQALIEDINHDIEMKQLLRALNDPSDYSDFTVFYRHPKHHPEWGSWGTVGTLSANLAAQYAENDLIGKWLKETGQTLSEDTYTACEKGLEVDVYAGAHDEKPVTTATLSKRKRA